MYLQSDWWVVNFIFIKKLIERAVESKCRPCRSQMPSFQRFSRRGASLSETHDSPISRALAGHIECLSFRRLFHILSMRTISGRNMAITILPTMTARITIMIGSSSEVMAATALSTSSS